MPYTPPTIDEYLLKRLMPVEGVIPHLSGIEMYGDSIPAAAVGGDLFESINFQQRYDIDARIQRALKLSKEHHIRTDKQGPVELVPWRMLMVSRGRTMQHQLVEAAGWYLRAAVFLLLTAGSARANSGSTEAI
jgi:hypothetical protein